MVGRGFIALTPWEGITWLKFTGNEKDIEKIPKELRGEVLSKLGNPRDQFDETLGSKKRRQKTRRAGTLNRQ